MSQIISVDEVQLRKDVGQLAAKMAQYQAASRKSIPDVLRKQGGNLAIFLSSANRPGELKEIAPKKGVIRAQNLARLQSGGGIKISQKARRIVYQDRGIAQDVSTRRFVSTGRRGAAYKRGPISVNVQRLLVQNEISLRSRASGFLAYGASARGVRRIQPGQTLRTTNRVGRFLADANMVNGQNAASISLYENAAADLIRGLSIPKARDAIHRAIAATIQDMDVYINRKQSEALKGAGLA